MGNPLAGTIWYTQANYWWSAVHTLRTTDITEPAGLIKIGIEFQSLELETKKDQSRNPALFLFGAFIS